MGMVQAYQAQCDPPLSRLFLAFLRMGITAFGGPAMIGYLRKMAVSERKWLDGESFQSGVALCQMVPGATAMQMAAYIGLRVHGVAGAAVSFTGFGLPAFILMVVLSILYTHTHNISAVISTFSGLQALIVAVVANAAISFGKTSLKNWRNALIAIIAAGLFGLMVNPAVIILMAALLGILLNGRQHVQARPPRIAGVPQTTIQLTVLFLIGVIAFGALYFFQKPLFRLASLMSKIDLLAFGGGFASVPLMFHEVVEARSWMDGSTFLDGIVLGQFTPGPIVITATFVGYLVNGLLGALVATIAIFLPSFLLVIGVTPYFDRLRASPHFVKAVGGILCSFVGLLVTVTIRFGFNVHWDAAHIILCTAAFGALLLNLDILWVVLAGTAISAFVF
ncbi:MAG: chromate efflux transporter [Syntrophobacteraceae bacterium]|jgi:chromate transporter